MPRIPGSKETRKVIELRFALCGSFLDEFDRAVPRKKRCCIKGCDHLLLTDCGKGTVATIADERLMPGPVPDPFIGWGCACCVNKILDQNS